MRRVWLLVLLALFGALLIREIPAIVRYLKIEKM